MASPLTFEAARQAIHGGRAFLTFRSKVTDIHFTYRLSKILDRKEFISDLEYELARAKAPIYVSVLTGPNNIHNYTYMGAVSEDTDFSIIKPTKNSKVTAAAKSWQIFQFILTRIHKNWATQRSRDLP